MGWKTNTYCRWISKLSSLCWFWLGKNKLTFYVTRKDFSLKRILDWWNFLFFVFFFLYKTSWRHMTFSLNSLWDAFPQNLQAHEDALWSKGIRGPQTVSLMPHDWTWSECGGPLNRGIASNAHAASRWTFHKPSPDQITTSSMVLTPTHTRINGLLSEWAAPGAWWIFPID